MADLPQPIDPSQIAENLGDVRDRIAGAALRSHRDAGLVTLVAVSKTQPVEAVQAAWEAGQRVFGENRVQEALEKMAPAPPEAQWHLVGHLQTNKARKVAGKFAMVHSLDSLELARELDKRQGAWVAAETPGPETSVLDVLVQLNWTGEETKSGIRSMAEMADLMAVVRGCSHLRLRGLMTMPDPAFDERATRLHFAHIRELLVTVRNEFGLGKEFDQLSMGMTHDFEWAIEEGATIVRVGTAIFGQRRPRPPGTQPVPSQEAMP